MSKSVIIRTLLALSAAAALFACSEKSVESYADIERRSLEAWIRFYAPQAEPFGDGMFIERLHTNPDGKPVEAEKWVMVSYQGMALDGSTFVSRYGEPMKIEGSYSRRAYYGPGYIPVFEDNSEYIMSNGQHEILMTMHEGDSVRAYIPSTLNYGNLGATLANDATNYAAYLGQYSEPASSPTIWIIKLEKVIDDPLEYELKQVEDYATARWGMGLADTLCKGFYFQVTRESPDSELISKDEILKTYYITRLLDGFLLDTNIDSVAVREWGPNEQHSTEPLSFQIMADAESDLKMTAAFDSLDGRMRYDEWARMVVSSDFGYGANGRAPSVNPYTPLLFEFYIIPPDEDEE